MFLIKCKCGCFFTLKNQGLDHSFPVCQNCGNKIRIAKITELGECLNGFDGAESINFIPENATIKVTFDA